MGAPSECYSTIAEATHPIAYLYKYAFKGDVPKPSLLIDVPPSVSFARAPDPYPVWGTCTCTQPRTATGVHTVARTATP